MIRPPLWCSRCLTAQAPDRWDGFNVERCCCVECLTDAEVDADLRAMGLDPDGLAERIMGDVRDKLRESGNTDAANTVQRWLDAHAEGKASEGER